MRVVGRVVGMFVSVVVLAGCYGGGGPKRTVGASGDGPKGLAGAAAASYDVPTLAGTTSSLAHYKGSVVVLNLWASWCTPCRQEMPELEQFYERHRTSGVVVLGVDQGESAQAARDFARSHGVTFPILLDADQQYGRSYAAVGLPTTIVVSRSGHVVQGIDGQITLAQMQRAVALAMRAQ